MPFPLQPPIEPMLSASADAIPEGDGLRYEPKWDGFRLLVFRDGDGLFLQSRKGQPLARYFPELDAPLRAALPERCVVDGELILPTERGLDFDALSQRIHPAASRVKRLSEETPASVVLFDCLWLGDDDLREAPLDERRAALTKAVKPGPSVYLTPHTSDVAEARVWFDRYEGAGLDGLVAKAADLRYRPGERVMVKIKHMRTVDCVVGGYRPHKNGGIGSLLLGLYDEAGVLHHVGHTSSLSAKERVRLLEELAPLEGGESFGRGRTPGAPSRRTQGKDPAWVALRPERVCEVGFDHLQGDRFRHAARLLRWRVDKAPEDCSFEQLGRPERFDLADVFSG